MYSKQFIPLVVVLVAVWVPLLAQTGMPTGSVEQQIRELEEQSRLAASKNDPGFLKQYGTNDYVAIGADGSTMTKNQAVQAMISGDIHYQSLDFINSPTVRIFGGDTAIVNGQASVELMNFGQPLSGTFRFTRVWVKQNGGWKIALFQATPEQPAIK